MAKNNLFLGTASRSVGDVTMYRRNGTQVSRVRVRKIANPKSYNQALQRNFLAPVARFYAPLSSCLERSWQGLNRSESYSAFLKKNVNLARTLGLYVEKGAPYQALPYQVSKGTLPPTEYSFDTTSRTLFWLSGFDSNNPTLGQLSQLLVGEGYMEGDQVTVIVFVSKGTDYLENGVIPVFLRFFIDTASTQNLNTLGNSLIRIKPATTGASVNVSVGTPTEGGNECVGGAIIISRFESGAWRRSTQSVVLNPTYLALFTGTSSKSDAIDSYRTSDRDVQSDVYLNGSRVSGVSEQLYVTVTEMVEDEPVTRSVAIEPYLVSQQIDNIYAFGVLSDGVFYPIKAVNPSSWAFGKYLINTDAPVKEAWSAADNYEGAWLSVSLSEGDTEEDRDNWSVVNSLGVSLMVWIPIDA